MDTRVPAGSVPSDEGASWSPSGGSLQALERRLAALEARLDDLDEAIRDGVPVATRNAVESACREVVPPLTRAAVQEELQGVRDELQRAIAELGRLLLRDLNRLTKVLADHRDTIVERLIGPEEAEAPTGDDEAEAPTGDELADAPTGDEVAEAPTAGDPAPDGVGLADVGPPPPPPTGTMTGEEGRWRVLPGRVLPSGLRRLRRRTRAK